MRWIIGDVHGMLRPLEGLLQLYSAQRQVEKSLKLLEGELKQAPESRPVHFLLAATAAQAGKLDLALPLFQEAAAGIEQRRFQHQDAARMINNLIDCHEQLKQFDQAEAWRRKWLAVVKGRSPADSLPVAAELAGLGLNLLQQKKWSDAEAVLRDCLVVREKKQPDEWTTFNTKSMLGEALLGQKKYADAEPFLVQGYEEMKRREVCQRMDRNATRHREGASFRAAAQARLEHDGEMRSVEGNLLDHADRGQR